MERAESIPLRAWIWLWMELAEELGPERAAELCGELRDRSAQDSTPDQPIGRTRAVGATWGALSDTDGEEERWHHDR